MQESVVIAERFRGPPQSGNNKAKAGNTYMVTAWPIRVEGKKHFAGSAIFDSEGNLVTEATTLWIGRRELN